MKKILLFLFLLIQSVPSFAEEVEDNVDYVSGFEDLPLMEGAIERSDLNFSFDTVEGSIVQSYIETDKPYAVVLAYYTSTLKDLGWVKDKTGAFKRDGSTLTIELVEKSPLLIKFELK